MNVLILDNPNGPTVYQPISYSNFIEPSDAVKLLIISSKGGLSTGDKANCLEWIELDDPTSNGLLEVHALNWHKKHGIHLIYTKQEDLILRGIDSY